MSRRKYSYIIYTDGKKEKIHNWYMPSCDKKDRMILVFANSGAYLYRHKDCFEEPEIMSPFRSRQLFSMDYEFVKLKGGVHNIDVYDKDIWYAVDNIERFEIVNEFA